MAIALEAALPLGWGPLVVRGPATWGAQLDAVMERFGRRSPEYRKLLGDFIGSFARITDRVGSTGTWYEEDK